MKERLLYRDKAGNYKVLDNAIRLGSLVVGDSTAVAVEDVVPQPRYAFAPPIRVERHKPKEIVRTYSYLAYNNYIAVAETKGRVSTIGSIMYPSYNLVRRLSTPDFSPIENKMPALRTDDEKTLLNNKDLGFLERKFFDGKSLTKEEKDTMKLNFILADNFFVFKGRAWFATRFSLSTGKLADGKNFKGTVVKVASVPRQDATPTAFESRYHHVFRVFVYGTGPYTMITEEQVVKASNQSASNSNFHIVLNEYTSPDLDAWTFSRVLAEDTNSASTTGLYAGYLRILKPAKYEHIKFDILGQPQYQVTNLPIGYQRPKLHYFKIAKEGDKLYAYWTHALGDRQVYDGMDGLAWTKKAVAIKGNKQGDVLL